MRSARVRSAIAAMQNGLPFAICGTIALAAVTGCRCGDGSTDPPLRDAAIDSDTGDAPAPDVALSDGSTDANDDGSADGARSEASADSGADGSVGTDGGLAASLFGDPLDSRISDLAGLGSEPLVSEICGDGVRGVLDEECDDAPSDLLDDSCTSSCTIRDVLAVVPGATGSDRYLGEGRHPVAAGEAGFAVVFVEPGVPRVAMADFDSKGTRTGMITEVSGGSRPVLSANPVAAALPGGIYAVAWTDSDGDGDELGVALRVVDPGAPPTGSPSHANTTTSFSQFNPDLLWTGTELIVAWVDGADTATAPDIKYRSFRENLSPRTAEASLAASDRVETNVALTDFAGSWAAAWREGLSDGTEELAVSAGDGSVAWTVGPAYLPGPSSDRPALVGLDDTHLLVVFTESRISGTALLGTPRLRAAVLDTAMPGPVDSFPVEPLASPYNLDPELSQTHPNAVRVGSRFYLAWRSERVLGDARGDELWLKPVGWSPLSSGAPALDLSAPELRLPREEAHQQGDQRFPGLIASPLSPLGAIAAAWDDLAQTFGPEQGTPDVVVELIPVPLLGYETPPEFIVCDAGTILAVCGSGLKCVIPCNGTVGDSAAGGGEDPSCTLGSSDIFGRPLTDESPDVNCGSCAAGTIQCFDSACFVPCDGTVECAQDAGGSVMTDEDAPSCGGPAFEAF